MSKTAILISVFASSTIWASERTVTVCLVPNHEANYTAQVLAEGYASRIYRSIGVELRWKHKCTKAEWDGPGDAFTPDSTYIGIEWAEKAPHTIGVSALAAARPFQSRGIRITLYLDRLKTLLESRPLAAAVLGHILAHEIGHVLLGHNGHFSDGLMKATWSRAEQEAMPYRLMQFAADQIEELSTRFDHRLVAAAAVR